VDTSGRRDALVRLMRRGGTTTLAALAERLEVSHRTVLRDLRVLRGRGFDVVTQGGPGGGVHLDPRSVLLSSQLATDEVVALILSVAVARAAPWTPFAAGAERALAKIEGALPAERVRELRRVMERILVGDPSGPGTRVEPVDPALLRAFEHAFTTRRVMRFAYVDRNGRRTRRSVEPHGLLVRAPLWYVISWDVDKDAARLFRMDRIARPVVRDDTPFRPRPFDLVTGVCPDASPPPRARSASRRRASRTRARDASSPSLA
jgi:predicted DNA-binding transcriptional regulator YafY